MLRPPICAGICDPNGKAPRQGLLRYGPIAVGDTSGLDVIATDPPYQLVYKRSQSSS
jgi:hypothetical protein